MSDLTNGLGGESVTTDDLNAVKWYIMYRRPNGAPGVYNLFLEREHAEAALPRHLKETEGSDSYTGLRVVSVEMFRMLERDYMINGTPLEELNARQWDYLLNVLPPMRWHNSSDFNHFIMSESFDGTYGEMIISLPMRDGVRRYFSKMVDVRDKSTYPTPESIERRYAAGNYRQCEHYQWLRDGADEAAD